MSKHNRKKQTHNTKKLKNSKAQFLTKKPKQAPNTEASNIAQTILEHPHFVQASCTNPTRILQQSYKHLNTSYNKPKTNPIQIQTNPRTSKNTPKILNISLKAKRMIETSDERKQKR